MDYQIKMLKIANSLDKKGYYELADNLTKYASEMDNIFETIHSAEPQIIDLEANVNDPEAPRFYFIADPHFMDDKKAPSMQYVLGIDPAHNPELYDEGLYFNGLYPNGERESRKSHTYNRSIIAKWNQMVRPQDVVFVVGDFAAAGESAKHLLKKFMPMLKGNIILIEGNHEYHGIDKKTGIDRRDREQAMKHVRELYGLDEPRDSYLQIPHPIIEQLGNNPILPSAIVNINQQGQDPVSLYLRHFEQENPELWYGAQNHLYGHTHGFKPDNPQVNSLDVGGYIHGGPVGLKSIQNMMRLKDPTKQRYPFDANYLYDPRDFKNRVMQNKKLIEPQLAELRKQNLPRDIYRMKVYELMNQYQLINAPVVWPSEVYSL